MQSWWSEAAGADIPKRRLDVRRSLLKLHASLLSCDGAATVQVQERDGARLVHA